MRIASGVSFSRVVFCFFLALPLTDAAGAAALMPAPISSRRRAAREATARRSLPLSTFSALRSSSLGKKTVLRRSPTPPGLISTYESPDAGNVIHA